MLFSHGAPLCEQVTRVIRCARACPGYRRIACLAVRAQPMLPPPPVCGFTSTAQLLVNPSSAFPSPSEAEDYREYLSVFFLRLLPRIQTYIKENIVSGGVRGRGEEAHLRGASLLCLINVVETCCQHVKNNLY